MSAPPPPLTTIALTGATGFLGAAVLDDLLARGVSVRVLTRRPQSPRAGVSWIAGDLADGEALARLVAGAEVVLHVAGVVNAPDAAGFAAGNVAGTAALLAAAGAAGMRRFVYVSSLAAREPKLSAYGASKAQAEALVQASPIPWVIVRPPWLYGPRDRDSLALFQAARLGVVPVPGRRRVSILHAEDLARLLRALALGDDVGVIFEPDDGQAGGWSHRALAQAIGASVGRRVRVLPLPAAVMRGLARLDRGIRGAKARLTPDRVSYMLHPDWVARAEAQPPPALWRAEIITQEGLAATARWYRAAGWL